MFQRQIISVGKLLLNVRNYRIVAQDSQKGARDAIIAEQGKKLVVLAKDIVANGLSPFDLPMVIDADDGNQNFIMMEGNRRLTAIQLLLDPELAKNTPLHATFVKLNKHHADAIPKVIDCTVAPNRQEAILWGNRKHASGLEGAGTETWTAMSKARAERDQGTSSPALDVVDFVLSNHNLDGDVRHCLEGSQFPLTTLQRLVTTSELQHAAGLKLTGGKIASDNARKWVQDVLTDIVSMIATGKKNGQKWTEREIDTQAKREAFTQELLHSHPGRKQAPSPWEVSGSPKVVPVTPKAAKVKPTPSTEDQLKLIPKQFKLSLPAGKVNDVFVELTKLDVATYRHAVSVLFRVFFEFTLEEFIKKRAIQIQKDGHGHTVDKLSVRLTKVLDEVRTSKLMTSKELKPINVSISDANSLLAPDTLNAYVHSSLMNPDPLQLKLMWMNVQLFVERLWTAK